MKLLYLENLHLLIAVEFDPCARGVKVHDTYLGEGDREEEGQNNDDYYYGALEMLLLLELTPNMRSHTRTYVVNLIYNQPIWDMPSLVLGKLTRA